MILEFAKRFLVISLTIFTIWLFILKKNKLKKILAISFLIIIIFSDSSITGFINYFFDDSICKECNVILIMPEVLRKDYVGLYSDVPYTPNLDEFFSDAWIFENFYGTAPWTAPSQTSLFTGLLPTMHGLDNRENHLNSSIQTIAEYLQSKGYYTASFHGGGYMGGKEYGMTNGFNYELQIGKIQLLTTYSYDAFEKITDLPKFFISISGADIHEPYTKNGNISSNLNYSGVLKDVIINPNYFERLHEVYGTEHILETAVYIDENKSIIPLSEEDIAYYRAMYADNVLKLDQSLQNIFNTLKEKDLLDKTIIILLSNHGEELYEHWVGHTQFYEPVINTPLLIKHPNSEFRIFKDLVSNIDIFPTLVQMLGYEKPENIGINFLKQKNNYVYGHNLISNHVYMITNSEEKLIVENLQGLGNVELYNLENDPEELNNLADKKNIYEHELYKKLVEEFTE